MDDFGTGYSSLSYLQSFPFDKIKIDRAFIKNIDNDLSSANIVRAIAAMAEGMNISTTAEGVETAHQLRRIRNEGCSEIQGFLISKPLSATEIERRFISNRDTFDLPIERAVDGRRRLPSEAIDQLSQATHIVSRLSGQL